MFVEIIVSERNEVAKEDFNDLVNDVKLQTK